MHSLSLKHKHTHTCTLSLQVPIVEAIATLKAVKQRSEAEGGLSAQVLLMMQRVLCSDGVQ